MKYSLVAPALLLPALGLVAALAVDESEPVDVDYMALWDRAFDGSAQLKGVRRE